MSFLISPAQVNAALFILAGIAIGGVVFRVMTLAARGDWGGAWETTAAFAIGVLASIAAIASR